jgi:PKD repeat protein
MNKTILKLILLVVLVLWSRGTLGLSASTLGAGWPYHRMLTVDIPDNSAPGMNIAWAEFYTNESRLPDGSDLRVTTPEGVVLPSYIMRISPNDDLVRLAFQAAASGEYEVSWGNPHPGEASPALHIDHGVLMEVFPFDNDAVGGGWNQMQAILYQDEPDESFFVPNIFNQFDPTGDYSRRMFLYQGQIYIAVSGTYTFAFDVSTMGYLNIDGQNLLVKNRSSGMAGRARFSKQVNLTPGWHQVEVGTVQLWGRPGAALDWRTPAEEQYSPVPPSAFAPIARAQVGALVKTGGDYAADFDISPEAQIFVPPQNYFQRYSFQINIPSSFAPEVTWNFSDGQQTMGLNVNHEFLTPGIYKVQVLVNEAGNTFTTERRISIQDQMYSRGEFPPDDPARVVAYIINSYRLDQLDAEQLYSGIQFFEKYQGQNGLDDWGEAWANSKQTQPADQVLETADDIAQRFTMEGQYDKAAAIYLTAADKQLDMGSRTQLLWRYAATACDYTQQGADVLATLQQWSQDHQDLPADAQHALQTALGYAAIATGNGKLAQQYVDAAGNASNISYGSEQIREGVLAHNAESYIQTRDFQMARKLLNEWDYEFPSAMLEGYTRLLRFELLSAQGLQIAAANSAVVFVNAEPDSFYSAELLYRAALAYAQGGEMDRAQTTKDRLKKDYPESPYAYKP